MQADSSFVVLKFGGTSVARPGTWPTILRETRDLAAQGHHPVVVCSALSGVTNLLQAAIVASLAGRSSHSHLEDVREQHRVLGRALGLDADMLLASEWAALALLLARAPSGRALSAAWQARVLAMGEYLSTRLGAAWLAKQDLSVAWVDARTLLRASVHQDDDPMSRYLSAACDGRVSLRAQATVRGSGAAVTVTQGFLASNDEGEIVLLGRGGSDTTAAYLAAMLDAVRLEIWTDVPGLFTTDPRITDQAQLLPAASYDEAAVLGALGAKVLHPRSLEPVRAHGVPLHVRWTSHPDVSGTVIGPSQADRAGRVLGIARRTGLCLLRMRRPPSWQPVGFMAAVSSCFARNGLSMDLVSSSPAEIRATIDLAADPGAADRLAALCEELAQVCDPILVPAVTCLSIVGSRISEQLTQVNAAARLLCTQAVHLVSHAGDDSHVSYVLQGDVPDALMREMHALLFDESTPVAGSSASRSWLGPTWKQLNEATPPRRRNPSPSPRTPAHVEARP